MVLIGLLLVLKRISLFIDVPLGEDTGFYENLFRASRVKLDLHSIVSLALADLLFPVDGRGVVELVSEFRVQLDRLLDFFGTEDPLRHLR